MPFDDSERGVSPVVGVILMVAITVILAAVIGTFVLDLGSNVQQNAQAGVDISQSPNGSNADVTITLVSLDNADKVIVNQGGSNVGNLTSVGSSVTAESLSQGDTVTILAELGGKKNVIQTYEVK